MLFHCQTQFLRQLSIFGYLFHPINSSLPRRAKDKDLSLVSVFEIGMSTTSSQFCLSILKRFGAVRIPWHLLKALDIKKLDALYEQQILEAEMSSFIPLIFSASCGLGPAATTTFMRLASFSTTKWQVTYPTFLGRLRCRLCFALTSIMCLCASRQHARGTVGTLRLANAEGQV